MGMDMLHDHRTREQEVQSVLDSLRGASIKEKEIALVDLRIEGKITPKELDELYESYAQRDKDLQDCLRGSNRLKDMLGRLGVIKSQ